MNISPSFEVGEFITGMMQFQSGAGAEVVITVPANENWVITSLGSSVGAGTSPEYVYNGQFRIKGVDYAVKPKQGSLSNISLFLKGGSTFGFVNADTSNTGYFTYTGFKLK